MKVFAVFSEGKAGLVKVWARSWESRGWAARLISRGEILRHRSARAAVRARGGGVLVDLEVINFSHRRNHRPRTVVWGRPGWMSAPLVRFPGNATTEVVAQCGRALWD